MSEPVVVGGPPQSAKEAKDRILSLLADHGLTEIYTKGPEAECFTEHWEKLQRDIETVCRQYAAHHATILTAMIGTQQESSFSQGIFQQAPQGSYERNLEQEYKEQAGQREYEKIQQTFRKPAVQLPDYIGENKA